jgi:aerobic carbon-monoxide dehydrogenase small subunit
LRDHPQPTEEEIRKALGGNLCMCTGYVQIVEAVKDAAEKQKTGGPVTNDKLDNRNSKSETI